MKTRSASGPSATAVWERMDLPAPAGRPGGRAAVMLLADAGNRAGGRDNLFYYLSAIPRLARTPGDAPHFSLTLELTRAPVPGETSILPLVRRGWLALTLTHGLSPAQRTALETAYGHACRALFARAPSNGDRGRRHRHRFRRRGGGRGAGCALRGAGADGGRGSSRRARRSRIGSRGDHVASATRTAPRATACGSKAGTLTFTGSSSTGPSRRPDRARRSSAKHWKRCFGSVSCLAASVGTADVPPRPWTDLDALLPRFVSAAVVHSREQGRRDQVRPAAASQPAMLLDLTETIESTGEARWSAERKARGCPEWRARRA